MRETCTSGSEGGGSGITASPYPYPFSGPELWVVRRYPLVDPPPQLIPILRDHQPQFGDDGHHLTRCFSPQLTAALALALAGRGIIGGPGWTKHTPWLAQLLGWRLIAAYSLGTCADDGAYCTPGRVRLKRHPIKIDLSHACRPGRFQEIV